MRPLNVVGFVEGARADSGSFGLSGVPRIHRALAEQGHEDVLFVAGDPIPASGPQAQVFPSHGFWRFAPGLLRSRVARAVRTCDFVSLHSIYSFPVLLGARLARRHRKPYGVWPHGVFAPVQRRIHPTRKRVYDVLVANAILKHASIHFFSAEGERDEMRPLGIPGPSVVIPHGIDLSAPRERTGRFRREFLGGRGGPMVLYLGRLNEKKGLDIAIRAMDTAWAACPTAVLAIAGGAHPPSFEGTVRRWAAESARPQDIVFTGVVSEAQKADAYADADVFILPSEAENFGFAMFEAMAARVPVIVSNTLDYAARVTEAGAGLAVARSPDSFGHAIRQVLQDREAARAMGANGPGLCAQFSWDACGRRFAEAIEAVVTGAPLPSELKPEYPA